MIYTTGDLARRFDVPIWRARRILDAGQFPTLKRVGPNTRLIEDSDLPAFEAAARETSPRWEDLACA